MLLATTDPCAIGHGAGVLLATTDPCTTGNRVGVLAISNERRRMGHGAGVLGGPVAAGPADERCDDAVMMDFLLVLCVTCRSYYSTNIRFLGRFFREILEDC